MDVGTDVLSVGVERPVAAVKTHPNPNDCAIGPWLAGQAALGVDCCPNRAVGSVEDGEEAVALGLLLVTPRSCQCRPDELAVAGEDRVPAVPAELLGEPRRALHVRE